MLLFNRTQNGFAFSFDGHFASGRCRSRFGNSVARSAASFVFPGFLGLTPEALCGHPLRGLSFKRRSLARNQGVGQVYSVSRGEAKAAQRTSARARARLHIWVHQRCGSTAGLVLYIIIQPAEQGPATR